MSVIESTSSSNAGGLIRYILDEEAHNATDSISKRNLLRVYRNVEKDYAGKYDLMFTISQFQAVRQLARNRKKKVQAYHLIFSFSDKEFPPTENPKELKKQTKQVAKLVGGYVRRRFPKNAQLLMGVQRDGKGHKLHVHVALNSVLTNGKVLNTNLVSVTSTSKRKGLRDSFDQFMSQEFEKVTGRTFEPIKSDNLNLQNNKARQINDRGGYVWKADLQDRVLSCALDLASKFNLNAFKQRLKSEYGVLVKDRQARVGVNPDGTKKYRDAYTYSFTGLDKRRHSARDYALTKNGGIRGLGEMYTPTGVESMAQIELQQQQEQQQSKQRSHSLDDDELTF